MKILVTGAKGFIGKNLIFELKNRNYTDILEYDIDTDASLLEKYCEEADIIYHIAGVNRTEDNSEYMKGNFGLISTMLTILKKYKNTCPIVMTSSILVKQDSPYGKSKKAGEELMFQYSRDTGAKVYIYRLTNVFGKWGRPNYNGVIATFCYNIARNLPITVNDSEVVMNLVYIDDVIRELIHVMEHKEIQKGDFYVIPTMHTVKLKEIASKIKSFKECREKRTVPDMSDLFTKKLYSTYLSYLPEDDLKYSLTMNTDSRGSFTEFIKTDDRGQLSINVSKPGVTKGNHWHHTKSEKFLVVNGAGVIRLRKITGGEVIEYHVSGDKMEVIDIPGGYTHNIENLGDTDMVVVMWANECFDLDKTDTYKLNVSSEKRG